MPSSSASVLQSLMAAAPRDPEARNHMLSVLRQAPLRACTWTTDASQVRVLTSPSGATALPLFTDAAQLNEAAIRYGWLGVDGSLPERQLTIGDAVAYARRHGIHAVMLDLAAAHALELDEGDMELLAAVSRTSTKPPSSRGLSGSPSSLPPPPHMPPTAPAEEVRSRPPRRHSSHTHLKPASVAPPAPDGTVSATFGGANQAGMRELADEPPPGLTDALGEVLRDYPEVEWAVLVWATRGGPGESGPAVALRVEPSFRRNVNEIIVRLGEAGVAQGATLDVLLLDDPEAMRSARHHGTPFFPWRKSRPPGV